MNDTKCEKIPIELLPEHPENSNHMKAEIVQKLRRHLEKTGRHEPITVRPFPKLISRGTATNRDYLAADSAISSAISFTLSVS